MNIYELCFLGILVITAVLFIWVYLLQRAYRFEKCLKEILIEELYIQESKYNHLKCKNEKHKDFIQLQDKVVKNLQEEIINLKIK